MNQFLSQLQGHAIMTLSTSVDKVVSSRPMSVVVIDGKLYFQTDRTMRKYDQLMANPHVCLCSDNLSVEGICKEVGRPCDDSRFLQLFQQAFPGSYSAYSNLQNERLFEVTPVLGRKWVYEEGNPFVLTCDFLTGTVQRHAYEGL